MKGKVSDEEHEKKLEKLEEDLFLDVTFDVQTNDQPQQSSATAPVYVKSIGRGEKKARNPLDIPLPWQYYEQLSKLQSCQERGEYGRSATPQRPAYPAQPQLKTNSKQSAPMASRERERGCGGEVKQRTRGRGRGRGRDLQEIPPSWKPKPSVVQMRDLGKSGLPNGDAELEEGKAHLMQMFLGKRSHFEPEREISFQCSDSSVRTSQTAPNFDLRNEADFPAIISKGMPFKSARSANGDAPPGRRKPKRQENKEGCLGSAGSRGDDNASSSCGSERRGKPTSNRSEQQHSDDIDPLEGPNVLELSGLPPGLKRSDLGDLLMGCGHIVAMKFLKDTDTQLCIGLAYVRMETTEACELAITSYDNVESPFTEMYDGKVPKLSVRLLRS
ncbi:uncharacterized protein [Diadema antillarum]|uniref:uncharacterized protein n=1 Tax=Diadema antillarum TaxID=105358 RepID=UPI003A89B4D1